MDIRAFLGLASAIGCLFIGIYKIKAKELLLIKILLLTVSISLFSIIISNWIFKDTIVFDMILVVGMLAIFSEISVMMWKLRKIPEKRSAFYVWFGSLAFGVIISIVGYILFW